MSQPPMNAVATWSVSLAHSTECRQNKPQHNTSSVCVSRQLSFLSPQPDLGAPLLSTHPLGGIAATNAASKVAKEPQVRCAT